ncbi:MAG: response regulator [Magnetococcus sp. YQC-3]
MQRVNDMPVRNKLIGLFLLIGLLPLLIFGWLASHEASEAMLAQSFSHLEAIRDIRKKQVEAYFKERESDVVVLATDQDLVSSMERLHLLAHKTLEQGDRIGGQVWQNGLEKPFIEWLENFRKGYGYHDILLIDLDGHVVYTALRESDLGEDLLHGPLQHSGVGQLFVRAQKGLAVQDFAPYAPSGGRQAAFMGHPIQRAGQIIGVLVVQLPTEGVERIMQEQFGLGKNGEAFLIGKQQGVVSYRSNRQASAGRIGEKRSDVVGEKALSGEAGSTIHVGVEGVTKLFSYAPLDLPGLNWAMLATTPLSDVDAPGRALIQTTLMLSLLLGGVVVGVAILVARTAVTPLQRLIQTADRIAAGEWTARVRVEGMDEFGQLGTAFNRMAESNEAQFWIKSHVAACMALLQRSDTPLAFAQSLIRYVTPLLEGGHGVVYLREEDAESYRLLGGYGHTECAQLGHLCRPGEGIVGQCILEKQPILLTQVPGDHIKIRTGLGESTPLAILVVPILFQNQVLAVVEIASYHHFTPLQQTLLDALTPMLGLGFENQNRSQRTETLLRQTQAQAQEMAALAEELRVQQEELQATNQALQSSEEELRVQQEELQATNQELFSRAELLERQKGELEVTRLELEEKARALATASQYKSEFLANMSHELRSPLNALLLLADDLAGNAPGNLSEDQVTSARVIHASGRDLLNLINDILDLAKIEAGKVELQGEELSLQTLAQQIRQQFAPLAAERSLSWGVEVADGVPEHIWTDRRKVGQVVKNLVSNAIKFTQEGGVTVLIQPASPPWAVAVTVRDTGIGIAQEKHALIFEPFQQADGSTTRQYGGTGLGLSISRELAERLGGAIRLQSQPGAGSLFTLFLPERLDMPEMAVPREGQPVAAAPATRVVEDDRERVAATDRVVLVIENDLAFAGFLSRLARERGFKCLVSASGEEGLQLARQHLPQGIILDLGLDGAMDGMAVMERLQGEPITASIPVHIVTAAEGGKKEGLSKGAMGYLYKPVNRAQLEEVFHAFEQCSSLEGKRLLLVDGDAHPDTSMVQWMRSQATDVTVANRGEDAYALLQQQTFHCLILNPNLPDMHGCDLLERIDRDADIANMPVILYTDKKLSQVELERLKQYTDTIVSKGSGQVKRRLMDEVTLFLHKVESDPVHRDGGQEEAVFKGKTVLLVDDDVRNTYALSKILIARGLTVLAAGNGESALKILERKPEIDGVLMDVMMPLMDGYETMRAIRKQERLRTLPIIALTAKAMRDDRERCLAAGANDYLAKPVEADKLLSLLRVWLSGGAA